MNRLLFSHKINNNNNKIIQKYCQRSYPFHELEKAKLVSNESHVRASHAARKTAIRKAYRFCKRETLHQTSAGFHVRRLINARFHPACSPPPSRAREETLSPSARWSVALS